MPGRVGEGTRLLARFPTPRSLADVMDGLRLLATEGGLDLPLPGHGATRRRFQALTEIGATDLSLVRLAEGHADALAILAEAERDRSLASSSALYGVWAAESPIEPVVAEKTAHGWILGGRKRYASGARGLDRALVTARAADGGRLFDVDLRSPGVRPVPDSWNAVGMAATESLDVIFDDVMVRDEQAIGAPDFYLDRPGFWWGAIGVAACWTGGALGAFRMLRSKLATGGCDPHQAAHLGAIAAIFDTMTVALEQSADDIDAGRTNMRGRALIVRQIVEVGCQEILGRVGRAGGTTPLAFDPGHARRAADLVVYLRQHHAERDLEALGRLVLEGQAWS